MAIEKFLALEDGEAGFLEGGDTARISYIPFAGGGNGIRIADNGFSSASAWVWGAGVFADIPLPNTLTDTVYIEFTSTTHWKIGIRNLDISFTNMLLSVRHNDNNGPLQTATLPEIDLLTPHRWGVSQKPGVSGVAQTTLLCDDVEIASITHSTTTTTPSNRIRLCGPFKGVGSFDSVVISTGGFKGDCHVDYLVPDGNGDTNEWLGSDSDSVDNYLLVNEVPPSAVQFVEADGEDLVDLYTVTNLPASGEILAVEQVVSAWKAGPNPQHPLNYVLKTPGGTDVEQGPELLASMQTHSSGIKLLNPEGNPWTVADVNNLQIGVTSEAL